MKSIKTFIFHLLSHLDKLFNTIFDILYFFHIFILIHLLVLNGYILNFLSKFDLKNIQCTNMYLFYGEN